MYPTCVSSKFIHIPFCVALVHKRDILPLSFGDDYDQDKDKYKVLQRLKVRYIFLKITIKNFPWAFSTKIFKFVLFHVSLMANSHCLSCLCNALLATSAILLLLQGIHFVPAPLGQMVASRFPMRNFLPEERSLPSGSAPELSDLAPYR